MSIVSWFYWSFSLVIALQSPAISIAIGLRFSVIIIYSLVILQKC